MHTPIDQTIGVGSISVNLTCYGFHVWAGDFFMAAELYSPHARPGSFAEHFLYCQSIELSLKAFLSFRGSKRKTLKKTGHNLERLLSQARSEGIDQFIVLVHEDDAIAKAATEWYDSPGGKRFQYFRVFDAATAFKEAPPLRPLRELASRLQSDALRRMLLENC